MSDIALKPEVSYDYKKGEDRMLHRCSSCGRLISYYVFGYSSGENGLPTERRFEECPGCGQKIDWSGIPWPGEHDIWAGTYGKSESTPPPLRATSPYTGEALGAAEGRKTRLIDAIKFEKSIQLSIESWGRDCNSNAPTIVRTYKDVLSRLGYAPTVDAVEVVRCGNCLYYSETIGKDSGKPCGYGSCTKPFHITNIVVNESFCSFGQRRADAMMDGDGNA